MKCYNLNCTHTDVHLCLHYLRCHNKGCDEHMPLYQVSTANIPVRLCGECSLLYSIFNKPLTLISPNSHQEGEMEGRILFALAFFGLLIVSNIIAYVLGLQTPEDYPTVRDEPHPF